MSDELIPRDKVMQIAESYRALEALKRERAGLQATMIRACLQRIQRKPGAFADAAERVRVSRERQKAFEGLETLAEMLEKQANVSDDPTPIDGRTE